jgi:hypothetical protein
MSVVFSLLAMIFTERSRAAGRAHFLFLIYGCLFLPSMFTPANVWVSMFTPVWVSMFIPLRVMGGCEHFTFGTGQCASDESR